MKWQDKGVVLYEKPLAEKGSIVSIFTRDHGRHYGYAKGSKNKQMGHYVFCEWMSRQESGLGTWVLEREKAPLNLWLADRNHYSYSLIWQNVCVLLEKTLPERHVYQEFFDKTENFVNLLVHYSQNNEPLKESLLAYVLWEDQLIHTLGFGKENQGLSENLNIPAYLTAQEEILKQCMMGKDNDIPFIRAQLKQMGEKIG